MDSRYALLFQKTGGNVINSFSTWGIVCSKVPFKVGGETKNLEVNDWYDEQGEDPYIPPKLMLKAYDVEFELAYKGQELAINPFNLSLAFNQIEAFKKWLTGNDTLAGSGAELKIYSPYSSIGRQRCYLKGLSDENPHLQLKQEKGNLYHENVLTFKVVFRVCDPITSIILST